MRRHEQNAFAGQRSTLTAPRLRCALYTRKSSEEGLEQGFNSLHAQREACEAYVLSQAGEGWTALPQAYDDGGFSGGSMERPALKALMAAVEAGEVDVVVVYKVDRLTRSLMDIARIVEAFDRRGVSFVSVTQAFNTTTSMGRLTLNVLLSFAQFEREVTGERIRDKIAASKRKGLWMGGAPPLGYDGRDHRLHVVESEAETVRTIYRRYLELGSVDRLLAELRARGVTSKAWTTRSGKAVGGAAFSRGSLYHLLQNKTYLGLIVHKDEAHQGEHPSIVDRALFEEIQALIASQRVKRAARSTNVTVQAPLTGLLFDFQGQPLTPTFSVGRKGRRYRYYLGPPSQDPGALHRFPAPQLEAFVLQAVQRLGSREGLGLQDLPKVLRRVEVRAQSLELVLDRQGLFEGRHLELVLDEVRRRLGPGERAVAEKAKAGGEGAVRVSLPARMQFRGGRTWVSGVQPAAGLRCAKVNPSLVRALRAAHRLVAELGASPLQGDMHPIRGPETTYLTRLCRLAYLAPDIQLDILHGRQPPALTLAELLNGTLPLGWDRQRAWLKAPRQPARRGEQGASEASRCRLPSHRD